MDGNKRAGVYAALVFLEVNGVEVVADPVELAELVLQAAQGRVSKEQIAEYRRSRV